MCDSNAYILKDGTEELVMESVDIMAPEPGQKNTWRLVDIFGDQKTIRGRIKGMQLVEHKIMFEPVVP